MSVIVVCIPKWETNVLVLDVLPGMPAVTVKRGRIQEATLEATKQGVEKGMRLTLAQHLCPYLEVLPVDKSREQRAFTTVMEALDEVTPFAQVIRPGIALFPVPPQQDTVEYREQLVEATIDAIASKTGAESYAAWGQTILEAWLQLENYHCAAQQRITQVEDLPLASLRSLFTAEDLNLQTVFSELLLLGVETIGEVKALGWDNLTTRFGLAAQTLRKLVEENWVPGYKLVEPTEVSFSLEFANPVEDPLLIVGQTLGQAQKLIAKLQGKQVSPQGLCISAQMLIPTQVCNSLGEVETQVEEISLQRSWAVFDFPTASEVTSRLQWQLQAWLQTQQRKLPLTSEDYSEQTVNQLPSFGFTGLTVEATCLTPIAETTQKLWGNRSASEIRALDTAIKLQAKLGQGQVLQVKVRSGWDPLSRVEYREWGEQVVNAAWEDWNLKEKHRDHPTYSSQCQWWGKVSGEAPSIVFTQALPACLLTGDREVVQLKETGLLNAVPTYLQLPAETLRKLSSKAVFLTENQPVTEVYGPWVQLGGWWEPNPTKGKAWLRVKTNEYELLLVLQNKSWQLVGIW